MTTMRRLREAGAAALRIFATVSCASSVGCGGGIASPTESGAPADAGADAGRLDAKRDTSLPDSPLPGTDARDTGLSRESGLHDAGRYPVPPLDAAWFDGCAPHSCDAGDLCIEETNPDMAGTPSVCSYLPPECGPNPSCLCVVEAVWWCAQPKCSIDGGVSLNCLAPGVP
jgi:hypothetical protein